MIIVPAVRAGRSHFLKLDPPEFRGLVENEAVFLRACARSDAASWPASSASVSDA